MGLVVFVALPFEHQSNGKNMFFSCVALYLEPVIHHSENVILVPDDLREITAKYRK